LHTIEEWTPDDVANWVQSRGFPLELVKKFRKSDVDGTLLMVIKEDEIMDEVGVSKEVAKQLIAAIHEIVPYRQK
jgi:hypothetical protein